MQTYCICIETDPESTLIYKSSKYLGQKLKSLSPIVMAIYSITHLLKVLVLLTDIDWDLNMPSEGNYTAAKIAKKTV